MIKHFKNKALEKLYHTESVPGIQKSWSRKIICLLDLLEAADRPEQLAMPGTGFHPLKGNRKHQFSMSVSGNWRLVFEYDGEGFISINLEDYH